ncbi:MAG: cob(I)yrinic acid a,c-diamide adenosyltransferase [Chlamydiales bacterium]|nr:cob(I)yrinic acid a,c-diamide adenosyltransferase [Chlamydiia bacterium]MCP5507226.1 cob(I)yrinic acid a,c-diamide adenosyltransferase [Chlamydiales bacterium]
MSKIYTRSGDKGETSLYTGQRVPKNDGLIQALGTVDECNCAIGVAIAHLPRDDERFDGIRSQLETIQHALFDLGAALATPRTTANSKKIDKTRFDSEEVEALETWIDEMQSKVEKLTTFILPGGHPSGALLHLARGICRRAECCVVPLHKHADVSDNVMTYLNRLSDYLFMASRYVNHMLDVPETKWMQHKLAPR